MGAETAPTVTLRAACLLSKWGFGDGDTPDDLLDYWGDLVDHNAFDWHAVLRRLVRTHLLPELQKHHDVEVHDVETAHNPIRAWRIDGREVAYPADAVELRPESVTVSYGDVMAAVRAELAAS